MVLAVAVVALMALQFWRVLRVEGRAREVEIQRARIAAEQLLREAMADPKVFALVPAAQQVIFRLADTVREPVVEAEVGWIREDTEAVPDLVVADRLDRAARAEFVSGDVAAAAREYAELLAGTLRAIDRMAVLSAAMWQAQRAGAVARRDELLQQGERVAGELPPSASGTGFVADAIAGTVRLRMSVGGPPPAWLRTVVPRLLPAAASSCVQAAAGLVGPDLQTAIARIESRRQVLAELDSLVHGCSLDLRGAGMAAPFTPLRMAWWQPRDRDTAVVAALSPRSWLDLVRQAGERGLVPQWPWLLEPLFLHDHQGASEEDMLGVAGIPGLGLRPVDRPLLGEGALLLPIATVVLLLAFVLLLTQQFRAARREAAAARGQTEFLTTVTHELKTPLASIRLLSELLAADRAPGQEREYYGLLAVETARLSMLIENVLDLGRNERGERAFEVRELDLGEVVRETVALFAALAERDGMKVELREDAGKARMRGDRSALVQALLNVLDNARKYASGGRLLEIAVANGQPDAVQVTVRDHGPGVPAGEREAIFDRFQRGREQQHGSIAGIGIGLYLARTIARRHGGELVCRAPASGSGAEFVFTLAKAAAEGRAS